jgi:mRNA-degrading endonuclease RelE of RelBE toxin-antitoxin system
VPTLSSRAKKDLDALPGALRQRADELIARLDSEPALGKKLLGKLRGLRSARLGRTHRVIYRVTDTGPEVITVSPRRDSYR